MAPSLLALAKHEGFKTQSPGRDATVTNGTPNNDVNGGPLRLWDERTGPEMFWLSSLSLTLLAGMIHINDRPQHMAIFTGCLLGFLGLYPAYWIDCFWALRLRSRSGSFHWLYAIFPPLRLGAKDYETGRRIWLPGLGWQLVGFELERRIQKAIRVPMISMTLLVLPMLAAEYFCSEQLSGDHLLAGLTAATSGIIWTAFTAEFVLMAAIARSKFDYCKQHWLELLIILLPALGVLGTVQIGRELRINQITKAANLYRLRGVGIRAWQSLTMFEFVDRLVSGPPRRRLEKLLLLVEKKQDELGQLEDQIRRIEARIHKPIQNDSASMDSGHASEKRVA